MSTNPYVLVNARKAQERAAQLATQPHAMYRFYDAAGDLLYVGISWSVAQRMASHRRDKPWWQDIVTVKIEWFPNRTEVLVAEGTAIQDENPKYNLTGATTNIRQFPQTPNAVNLTHKTKDIIGKAGLDFAILLNKRYPTDPQALQVQRAVLQYVHKLFDGAA